MATSDTADIYTRLNRAETAFAAHQEGCSKDWGYQKKFNADCHDEFKEINTRLSSLELKIMWMAGVASAAGALAGSFIPKVFP